MDKTTLPGLILALVALLGGAMMEGTTPDKLVMLPAFIIVIGGTFGAALISFPLSVATSLGKLMTIAIKDAPHDLTHVVDTFVKLADRARREGLLALEQEAGSLEPFTRRGIQMVVDGSDPALVREILEADIEAMKERHKPGAGFFEAMGGYAPTMGIIGTVMGLVHVLENLSEPDKLGPLIASAFLATLYGIFFANACFLPLASKLKVKSAHEAHSKELVVEGVMAVQAGDNPRVVREKLEAYLPPALRGHGQGGAKGSAAAEKKAA
ncbi:MAG: flagellar motor protein [Chloroflexi bacterium]|nr:flagellar motor protein [Chloroflexota bacterium]